MHCSVQDKKIVTHEYSGQAEEVSGLFVHPKTGLLSIGTGKIVGRVLRRGSDQLIPKSMYRYLSKI